MPGQFPLLQGMLAKRGRKSQGAQQANPMAYQAMPTLPQAQPGVPAGVQDGATRQAEFNEKQKQMNKGMIGGRMNRRSF